MIHEAPDQADCEVRIVCEDCVVVLSCDSVESAAQVAFVMDLAEVVVSVEYPGAH